MTNGIKSSIYYASYYAHNICIIFEYTRNINWLKLNALTVVAEIQSFTFSWILKNKIVRLTKLWKLFS